MALQVTDECVCCSACIGECPASAIEMRDCAYIDPERCDECGGDEPRCQPVCPVECIISAERAP